MGTNTDVLIGKRFLEHFTRFKWCYHVTAWLIGIQLPVGKPAMIF